MFNWIKGTLALNQNKGNDPWRSGMAHYLLIANLTQFSTTFALYYLTKDITRRFSRVLWFTTVKTIRDSLYSI